MLSIFELLFLAIVTGGCGVRQGFQVDVKNALAVLAISDFESCCTECTNLRGCLVWSFNSDDTTCTLSNRLNDFEEHPNSVAGTPDYVAIGRPGAVWTDNKSSSPIKLLLYSPHIRNYTDNGSIWSFDVFASNGSIISYSIEVRPESMTVQNPEALDDDSIELQVTVPAADFPNDSAGTWVLRSISENSFVNSQGDLTPQILFSSQNGPMFTKVEVNTKRDCSTSYGNIELSIDGPLGMILTENFRLSHLDVLSISNQSTTITDVDSNENIDIALSYFNTSSHLTVLFRENEPELHIEGDSIVDPQGNSNPAWDLFDVHKLSMRAHAEKSINDTFNVTLSPLRDGYNWLFSPEYRCIPVVIVSVEATSVNLSLSIEVSDDDFSYDDGSVTIKLTDLVIPNLVSDLSPDGINTVSFGIPEGLFYDSAFDYDQESQGVASLSVSPQYLVPALSDTTNHLFVLYVILGVTTFIIIVSFTCHYVVRKRTIQRPDGYVAFIDFDQPSGRKANVNLN